MKVDLQTNKGLVALTNNAGETLQISILEFWEICRVGARLNVIEEIENCLADEGEIAGVNSNIIKSDAALLDRIVEKVMDDRIRNENGSQVYDAIKACVRDSKMITFGMVKAGYEAGLVRLIDSPHEDGVVCAIGANWFYFGGQTAEGCTVDEYKAAVPKDTIIKEIFDVLDDFEGSCLSWDEYRYYGYYLSERLKYVSEKTDSYEIEVEIARPFCDTLEVTLTGTDLVGLKREVASTIKRLCEEAGYTCGTTFVDMTVLKNGEFFDYDGDGVFDLDKGEFVLEESAEFPMLNYEDAVTLLCEVLNKRDDELDFDDVNQNSLKEDLFVPIFKSENYFGIYVWHNEGNEYYLVNRKNGEYKMVLGDSFEFVGKNLLDCMKDEKILHVANTEWLRYLIDFSLENVKNVVPERELEGIAVLDSAWREECKKQGGCVLGLSLAERIQSATYKAELSAGTYSGKSNDDIGFGKD